MDPPLPDDFDLAEHYGDAGLDDPFHDDEEDGNHDEQQEAASHGPQRPARKPAPERSDSPHEKTSMLKALFEFFIPPLNQNPETRRRWRIAIGFAVFCLSTATLHSYGIFAPFGFQGFASASDVKAMRGHQLNRDILDAIIMQCTVIAPESTASPESRRFYANWVQGLVNQFREAEGIYPRLPTCDEVL